MGDIQGAARFGDTIPALSELTPLTSAPVPGGHHLILSSGTPDDDSIYQRLVDPEGAPLECGAKETGRFLFENLHSGDPIGAGVFLGSLPAGLSYVRHSRTPYRLDILLGSEKDPDPGHPTHILTLYRHVWPGVPVEVEALSTITGRFSLELVAHIEYQHEGRTYVLGTVRRLPRGINALEYTKRGIAAHVVAHSQGIDLGQTLRYIHDSFLMAFPYEWAPAEHCMEHLEQRLDTFTETAPRLAEYAPWIREWYRSIRGDMLVHRLHGNVNLKQMWLDEEERWVIGGWSGDVRLPMEERARLGSPLEDLASLHRSVFRACEGNSSWCHLAMESIFEGYGEPLPSTLFCAFILDRACEEFAEESSQPAGHPGLITEFLDDFRETILPQRDTLPASAFLRSAQ
ncbi:hypothetical protein GCM10027595_23030 [Corynebacterium nasicanis]